MDQPPTEVKKNNLGNFKIFPLVPQNRGDFFYLKEKRTGCFFPFNLSDCLDFLK